MVLVIDTSSPWSALALVGDGGALAEDVAEGGREHDLPGRARALADPGRLTAVAVSLGPGSFTGLRVGVSYGLGLAMGLGVPLLGLGSLDLQAARACPRSAIPLVEAGRGRVYWRYPSPLAGEVAPQGAEGGAGGPALPGRRPGGGIPPSEQGGFKTGEPLVGSPDELPRGELAVGWLRPATAGAVRAAGLRLLPEEQLAGFATAAARLLETAEKLDYDTVKLRYAQHVRPVRE